MTEPDNPQPDSNRVDGGQPERKMQPVTIISMGIIVFLLIIGGWWVFLGDHIPDDARRVEVWVQSVLSTAIFIVVAIQACIYFRQAKALDRQVKHAARQNKASNKLAETALKQFEITDRPWLKFTAVFSQGITFNKGSGLQTQFTYTATNVGRSVAVNATITTRIVIPEWRIDSHIFDEVLNEQAAVCKEIAPNLMSYAIFPDSDYTVHYGIGVIGDTVERGKIGNSDYFSMFLVGCVDYQFVGHTSHHQTRFAYEVIPRGHSVKIGENVPLENLTLRKLFFGGDYAD